MGLLVRARTPARQECFGRDESTLVDDAVRLRFASFARVVAYWAYLADPDGAEADAAARHQARRLHRSQSFGGMWLGDFALDAVAGAIVHNQLRRIDDELFAADWAEARARLGTDPTLSDLGRTPAQRRADALVEMAVRSATSPADRRRPEPLFSVLVGYETLAGMICELADGTVVTPGSLVPWLDRSWIERVVFDGPSRVTDVGVRRRLFQGAGAPASRPPREEVTSGRSGPARVTGSAPGEAKPCRMDAEQMVSVGISLSVHCESALRRPGV